MDLRGLSKSGRALNWTLENVPMRDGWVRVSADGWLMEDPPGLGRTVAGLKATLRSLARRGAVRLVIGADGELYARHVNRVTRTENTQILTAPGDWRAGGGPGGCYTRPLVIPGLLATVAPREPGPGNPDTYGYAIVRTGVAAAPVAAGTGRNLAHAKDQVRGWERHLLDHPYAVSWSDLCGEPPA